MVEFIPDTPTLEIHQELLSNPDNLRGFCKDLFGHVLEKLVEKKRIQGFEPGKEVDYFVSLNNSSIVIPFKVATGEDDWENLIKDPKIAVVQMVNEKFTNPVIMEPGVIVDKVLKKIHRHYKVIRSL